MTSPKLTKKKAINLQPLQDSDLAAYYKGRVAKLCRWAHARRIQSQSALSILDKAHRCLPITGTVRGPQDTHSIFEDEAGNLVIRLLCGDRHWHLTWRLDHED